MEEIDVLEEPSETQNYLIPNKVYTLLRALVEIIIPATATLFLALAEIWNLSYGVNVSASLGAVALFIGAVIRIGNRSYDNSSDKFDGALNIDSDGSGAPVYTLVINPTGLEKLNKGQGALIHTP